MKPLWTLLATWLVAPWILQAQTAAPPSPAPPRPPNIIVVLADDLGWTDGGFAGSRFYETPNLDALAAGGMRFTSHYASALGLPARATLLTGQDAPRTGVYTGDSEALKSGVSLPAGRATVASVLKQAGYATGFVGVWGLDSEGEGHPLKRGFDEAVITSPKHFGFEAQPATEVAAGTHLADFITDRALDFMERHQEKPFFLEIAHFSVHAPTEPKTAWVARFEKKPPAGGHRDAAYAAMIAGLDESVGRVVARVESLQLTGRTVILFTSDNGGLGGYVDPENAVRRKGVTDNSPLRGGKGMVYEGGLRVPFIVRWPGVVTGGTRSSYPVGHVDLFPTLVEIGGGRVPADHVLDGLSLLPVWRNASGHVGRDALYWHFPTGIETAGPPAVRTPPVSVVRAGNFKLIEYLEDGRVELYNVVDDLGEKDNLVRSLPEKAAELKAKLAAWRKASQAPMPAGKAAATVTPPASAPAAAPKPKP